MRNFRVSLYDIDGKYWSPKSTNWFETWAEAAGFLRDNDSDNGYLDFLHEGQWHLAASNPECPVARQAGSLFHHPLPGSVLQALARKIKEPAS